MKLDTGLLQPKPERYLLSTVVKIKGLNSWTNGQILHLAQTAHKEAEDVWNASVHSRTQTNDKRNPPTVTSTLIIGSTAYIATSMRGLPKGEPPSQKGSGVSIQYKDLHPVHQCKVVEEALSACQTAKKDDQGHRTTASCGEIMALVVFCCSVNQQIPSFGKCTDDQQILSSGKIVSIIGGRTDPKAANSEVTDPRIVKPCGYPGGTKDQFKSFQMTPNRLRLMYPRLTSQSALWTIQQLDHQQVLRDSSDTTYRDSAQPRALLFRRNCCNVMSENVTWEFVQEFTARASSAGCCGIPDVCAMVNILCTAVGFILLTFALSVSLGWTDRMTL
nr:hypothetical protein CFP56_25787 [Quercus suber]